MYFKRKKEAETYIDNFFWGKREENIDTYFQANKKEYQAFLFPAEQMPQKYVPRRRRK
jgi:hypothetical protein